MANLYVVSTPIGNLGDITYRAVDVLGRVGRILAEDTRRTSILLRHYGITTRLVSAHAHNEAARAAQLVTWLDAGEDVAIVSDAGTPLISDPGARIVQRVVEAGHRVIPVPGPSALLAALVASGLEPEPFTFFGFTPRSGQARAARLAAIEALPHTAVLYEAPGRLAALLRELKARCGDDRRVVVARELTKVHETFFRGTLAEAAAYYAQEAARGEVVVLLAGSTETAPAETALDEARALARELLAEGRRPSTVARELARRLGLSRNQAYDIVVSIHSEDEEGGREG
ncbi:MAG TPA: 16S rRNA (cytidine(1402)-2'-O)-methyltransferase [Longimicrobiales bacterium]